MLILLDPGFQGDLCRMRVCIYTSGYNNVLSIIKKVLFYLIAVTLCEPH